MPGPSRRSNAAIVDGILSSSVRRQHPVAYRAYLRRDHVHAVHEGYFSIDEDQAAAVDGPVHTTGDRAKSKDVDAYDLILKDKGAVVIAGRARSFHLFPLRPSEGGTTPTSS